MNRMLINSRQEFLKLMKDSKYWANPTYDYEKDWYYKNCFPDKFPCLVIHQHTWDHYRGREGYDLELVYLEDFGLRVCEACEKTEQENLMVWEYYEDKNTGIWQNGLLCEKCLKEANE